MAMIELKDTSIFSRAINAIAPFISEGNFRFAQSGLQFLAMDPSQIVLVSYKIPKSAFDHYALEPAYVGLDVTELSKVVSRVLPDDRMQLDLTESALKLRLDGAFSRTFRLSLLDLSDEEPAAPQSRFDAKVQIRAKLLKEALKDAALFGTSVVLRVKNGAFAIEARGSQGTLDSVSRDPKKLSVSAKGEVVSKYSLSFLQNMIKEADNDDTVTLELKSDAPLKLSYPIGEGHIAFHLAHMLL